MTERGQNGDEASRKSDPTLLTTQQLIREQTGLKELVLSVVEGKFNVIDTRLIEMNRAIELVHGRTGEHSDFVREQVGHLKELHNAKFDNIGTQFDERDKRTEQLAIANKTAIDAALQTQKETSSATNESASVALTKLENNFATLIAQGKASQASDSRNLEDKINDVKSRLDRGEGKTSVSDPSISDAIKMMNATLVTLQDVAREGKGHKSGVEQSWGIIVAIAGIAAVVVVALIKFHS
jgi:hypothetical protein